MRLGVSLLAMLVLAVPAAAQDLTTWRHGTVQAKGDAGFLFMAAEGDFGKKYGLDIDMTTLKGDTLLLKALLSGEIDSYEGAIGSPLIAASKGADIRVVGCHWQKLTYILFAQPEITSVADLKGKTIGVSAPGSQPDLFARAVLRENGIDGSEVTFVTAGSDSERIAALAAHVLDAAPSASEFAAKAEEIGVKPLVKAVDVLPDAMRRCFYVRAESIEKNPEQVAGFLAAELDAYEHSFANKEEMMALSRKIAKLPPESSEPEFVYDEVTSLDVVSDDFRVDVSKLVWQRDLLASVGSMDANFDPATILDLEPLEAAHKLRGE